MLAVVIDHPQQDLVAGDEAAAELEQGLLVEHKAFVLQRRVDALRPAWRLVALKWGWSRHITLAGHYRSGEALS